MRTVGLIPGSYKPYHRGHDDVVRIAAEENDEVIVFVSLADRTRPGELPIYGSSMKEIWERYILPSMPSNVDVRYSKMPPRDVFQTLENADGVEDGTIFTIYSDINDIKTFSPETLAKYVPTLAAEGRVRTRGLRRGIDTTDVSGTAMRKYIQTGQVDLFKEMLPTTVQRYAPQILKLLQDRPVTEAVLKQYIRMIVTG